jgi:hypothetical protein
MTASDCGGQSSHDPPPFLALVPSAIIIRDLPASRVLPAIFLLDPSSATMASSSWRSDKDGAMDVERAAPALYERLGPRASSDLAVLLDAAQREWAADVTTTLAERFERRLTTEVAGVRVALAEAEGRLRADMAGLRTEMHDGDASIRQDLLNVRNELLRWSFAFWMGQMIAMGGLIAAVLRLAA